MAAALTLAAAMASSVASRAGDVLFAVDVTERPSELVKRVNPYTGVSEVVWKGGSGLDIAVSWDLTRLYVNHLNGVGRGQKLTAVDLATGTRLITIDTPNRLRETVMAEPVMKLSPDGKRLYTLNLYSSAGSEEYTAGVFDTDFSRFLGEEASLGECSGAQLWPLDGESELLVVCRGTGVIHSMKFSNDGAVERHDTVQVPPPPVKPVVGPRVGRSDSGEAIAQAALDQDGRRLYLAKINGSFLKLDVAGLTLSEITVDRLRKGTGVRNFGSAFIEPSRWLLTFEISADYDIVFVLQGRVDLDTRTVKFPETRGKSRSRTAVDPGGQYVYITNPDGEGIHVLDAATAEPVTVIETVRKPAFVVRRTRD